MILQMEPWVGEEERRAVNDYLGSGGWLTEFTQTQEFARMIGEFVKSKHTFIFPNGTTSLFAALVAAGVQAGDEVCVPDLTMIASANAIKMAGARPVFVDVSSSNLCMDMLALEKKITPRTKALVVVSLNGRAPDMTRVTSIARNHGLAVVEDAAQSLGSHSNGRHLGTFGDAGCFSFSAPKIITTGQGGAVVTSDDEIAERIRRLRDFGRSRGGEDFHQTIGYNFKFTDLQAVVGIEQMKKLTWRVERKKQMFKRYGAALADIPEVEIIETDLNEVCPWFIDVFVPDPDALQSHLKQQGIQSRRVYPPIHSQPAYAESGHYPNSEHYSSRGLWLPSSSFLSDPEIDRITENIKDYFRVNAPS